MPSSPAPFTVAVSLLLVGLATPLHPQGGPPPVSFGAQIEVVNLSVSVTTPDNQYVTDLGRSDFAVFEDGVRQDLSLFNHEDLPLSMVFLLDTSASMAPKLEEVRTAARRFLKTLRPKDSAQVLQFNDRIRVLQEFSSDPTLLAAAVDKTEARGPTALHNAVYLGLKNLDRRKRPGEQRRSAVVLLSDGEDTASLVTDEQVVELAKKLEINIYTVMMRPGRAADRNRATFSQAAHLLNTLTRETGGRSYFPASISELDSVYDRIALELRSLYSIGYISSNDRRDGKWRRIVVRTPDRRELQIRHKLGYFAGRS